MKLMRSFWKRITDDLKQKKLIPLKILFFVHASTLFVLYPYLTIHMRELGINVEETAIMSAVTPVVSIVMPPLAGMLADKIGNFRLLLALSSALGGASALLLLAVPVGRITVTFPPAAQLLAACDAGALRLRHVHDHACHPLHPYAFDVNLTTLSCGFVCDLPPGITKDETDELLHMHSYVIRMQSSVNSQQLVYRHTVSSFLKPMMPRKDKSTARILTNDPLFNTTASLIPPGQIFFPAPQLFKMECTHNTQNATCYFGRDNIISDQREVNDESYFRIRVAPETEQEQLLAEMDTREYLVKSISALDSQSDFGKDDIGVDDTTCVDRLSKGPGAVSVRAGAALLGSCASACAAAAPRASLCANTRQQIDLDPMFTFWAYLAVRVFIGIIGGTAFAMFEGAVIAIVRQQRADYGLQRVYGSIGGMISSPLSGMLIDYASRGKGYTDFRPAFYLYSVLKVLSGVLMLTIDLEFKQPAQNLVKDVITVFRNVELVALFTACFVMGTAWGYIESFLFWLLQDLGASRSLMGITITVGGIAGLPLLVLSGPIIRRLGHANVLFIGFVFYAIRLLGYSLIYNPWLCLVFEALESVTSSLAFTAAVTYAARLSSTTTDTSVQGLLGGLYYGVGKGAGSLIGGYLMKFFGTRPTYQIFSCATFVTGCMYFLFNKFYIGKRAMGDENDLCKKKPVTADVENRDTNMEAEKGKATLDGATKPEISPSENVAIDAPKISESNQKSKLVPDNTDGGSDSGVENPAYTETESIPNNASNVTVK